VAALALGCGIGAGSRPPTVEPGGAIEASPLPSDLPLDLDVADKLLHDGEVEQALAIYGAVAGSAPSDAAESHRALQSAARVYYGQGQFEEAEAPLVALLDADPPASEREPALLLLGAVRQQAGRADEARESLEEYLATAPAAAAHARVRLAAVLAAEGDQAAAVEQLQLALADDLPPQQATDALFALARDQEAAGQEEEAAATWQRAADDGDTPVNRGEALWQLAALQERTGEQSARAETLGDLASSYPWHDRALEGLNSASVSAAGRGIVLYNHRDDDDARRAFESALDAGESVAQDHYYLALLDERAGDPDSALEHYDAGLAALGGSTGLPLFGETAWERALLLETLGRTDEAVDSYVALAAASPSSERAAESLFRAGLVRFRQALPGEAVDHWDRYLELANGEDLARARYWLAAAYLAAGDAASADQELNAAAVAAPWDYYGLRAAATLAGETPPALDERAPDFAAPDWTTVETWLEGWVGPEDPVAGEGVTDGAPWRRGLELLRAGLQDEASDQFAALVNEVAGEPWPLYRLARALADQGQVEQAARAASRLIGERADAPPGILRLAYPVEYLDLVTPLAETNGFPPLLLLALIRQESFFRPDAQSFAGALGLTQVIPATADEIAGKLNEDDFVFGDLVRPKVSLRFGAYYLGEQLKLFEGDVPAALAAYNGGPGNSLRWREAAPDDADLFLEVITLSETRAYVELVLEHYAHYRYAYGLADGPSLALE
jgi:soluble lytic murein transglycosylase